MGRVRIASLVATLSVLATGPAAAYVPDLEYRTLTTPHFRVTAPQGYEHLAIRTARIAEAILPQLEARYGWTLSGRTDIVIDDQTDSANGSAQVLPSKRITLFVTAPTEVTGIAAYDDWLEMLVTHELVHIIHLDMAYGLPWLGRLIFGKYISMNSYIASWSTEGLAVYEETVASGAGRGRSTYADMVLRVSALADRFLSIDQAFRSYSQWPFGNAVYFHGGRFQLWLAEKFGEDALLEYHRYYASTAVPYMTWPAAEHAFGHTLETLWMAFEDEVTAAAQETLRRVEAEGRTRTERLTEFGGQVLGPQVTPDGRWVVFSTGSPVDGPRVRRMPVTGGESEVLVDDTLSKAISFSGDGKAFYFQQTAINQRFYSHNSLFRYDLEKGEARKVRVKKGIDTDLYASSGSLRARDPDVSRDGKKIVFVQNRYGANRLVIADLEENGTEFVPAAIVEGGPGVQMSNPRFSPDGKLVAISRFSAGRRDVLIYDAQGRLLEEVTRDRAHDVDPDWSADGRWLVFASDRSGISNLYAFDIQDKSLRQLSNVIAGAYQPCLTPDQETIIFRGYSADGFDVFSMPFAPDVAPRVPRGRMPPVDRDTYPTTAPAAGIRPPPPPDAPPAGAPIPDLPEGWTLDAYDPLPSLSPFPDSWNLRPLIAFDEDQEFARLRHSGRDALGQHDYSAWLSYYFRSRVPGGGAIYTNRSLYPSFTIAAETSVRRFSIFDDRDGAFLEKFDEQLIDLSFAIGVPIRQRHSISVGYAISFRRALREPSAAAGQHGVGFPTEGRFARVWLGYAYTNVRYFAHSISAERGLSASLALQGLASGVGSDVDQFIANGQIRYYLSIPWPHKYFRNHVLASRLALSIGAGDSGEVFRLGGTTGSSVLTTTTQNFFGLRGMVVGGLSGQGVISGGLEYRAPIWRVERGLGTFPLTLRVLHAALFTDFGRAFDTLSSDIFTDRPFQHFGVSVGAELRANVLIGWALGLELRLGWAQLLYAPSVEFQPTRFTRALDSSGFFFQIGSGF